MGRGARLKLELIEKEKSRMMAFKKRKEGLMKKLHELTTLCGISACMIIYDSGGAASIWPQNSGQEVFRLIDGYISKKKNLGSVKHYGVSDFFNDRQKEIDGELAKLRKKNLEAKYPSWDDRLSSMDESQLRGLSAALHLKARDARSRIQFLKQQQHSQIMPFYSHDQAAFDANNFHNFDQEIIKASDVMMQSNFQFPVNMQTFYAPMMIGESFYSNMDQNFNHWDWGC